MPINYFCAGAGFMGIVFFAVIGLPKAIAVCAFIMFMNLIIAGSHQRDSD